MRRIVDLTAKFEACLAAAIPVVVTLFNVWQAWRAAAAIWNASGELGTLVPGGIDAR